MASTVRRARPDEAASLSELAVRSKAYWGYDAAFMAVYRDDLSVAPEALTEKPYYLLEIEDRILGFYNLSETPGGVSLQNLFVSPEVIGQGVGKRLWAHMEHEAETLGYTVIFIESDPYAKPFYLARGAERVGSAPSSVLPGWTLPLLEFRLSSPRTR